MKEIRNGEFVARGNPLIRHDLKFDVTPAPLPESARGERFERSTEKVVSWEREERTGAEDHRKTTGTEESTRDFKRDFQNTGI